MTPPKLLRACQGPGISNRDVNGSQKQWTEPKTEIVFLINPLGNFWDPRTEPKTEEKKRTVDVSSQHLGNTLVLSPQSLVLSLLYSYALVLEEPTYQILASYCPWKH